jgi:hypothetical protein
VATIPSDVVDALHICMDSILLSSQIVALVISAVAFKPSMGTAAVHASCCSIDFVS